VVALVVAQLADLFTFLLAVRIHPNGESNPIASHIYSEAGPLGIIVFKLALLALILGIVVRLPERSRKVLIVAGVVIGMFGALTNTVVGLL
jgi:hypothetical protein